MGGGGDLCRCCGTGPLEVFHRTEGVPVANSALYATADEAAAVATGDLVLGCCTACGFIQNTAFEPSLVTYAEGYEDTQAHSARFVDYATGLSRELVGHYDLAGARTLEIGSGKGDFLRILCQETGGTGIGYDPATGRGALGDEGCVELRAEPFDEAVEETADLIVCRHTLEHIADVRAFVEMVARWAAAQGSLVMFEVPDTMRILEEAAFWDLYYEHCSYFTAETLGWLFESAGFEVLQLRPTFEHQYLVIEARPGGGVADLETDRRHVGDVLAATRGFGAEVTGMRELWRRYMMELHEEGLSMVIWGGSSKSVAFLAETDTAGCIDAVVDINPCKHGRYLPGSAIEVVSPEWLVTSPPDLVLVMNPYYEAEIRRTLASLSIETEVVAP